MHLSLGCYLLSLLLLFFQLSTYYEIFCLLEHQQLLDIENAVDMFCLHLSYLCKINMALEEFTKSWNSHKLRTEGNQTPTELFMKGMLRAAQENDVPPTELAGVLKDEVRNINFYVKKLNIVENCHQCECSDSAHLNFFHCYVIIWSCYHVSHN